MQRYTSLGGYPHETDCTHSPSGVLSPREEKIPKRTTSHPEPKAAVFERLAVRLNTTPDAARKMCEDDVKKESLGMSPEDYAQLYLAGIG